MRAYRKSISKRVRYAVLERDGYRCRYCGAAAADAKLHVDHRMPVSRGGTDDFSNLVTACADCNLGKHAFLPIREISRQRELALAALIFQKSCEKFGDEVPMWRAFCTILDHCLAEEDPAPLMQIVLDANSWAEADDAMFAYGGFYKSWGEAEADK